MSVEEKSGQVWFYFHYTNYVCLAKIWITNLLIPVVILGLFVIVQAWPKITHDNQTFPVKGNKINRTFCVAKLVLNQLSSLKAFYKLILFFFLLWSKEAVKASEVWAPC